MNKEIFDLKLSKVSRHSLVDYALWGGLVGDYDNKPDSVKNNMNDLVDLYNCGVAAFKGFTCPNGDLFPTVNLGNVRKALEILKPYNALCGFHCEEYGQVLEREKEAKSKENRTNEEKIRDFLDSHDVWTEYVATKNVIDMARATGGRVHICHVSHPMVAQVVKDAIHEGLPITACLLYTSAMCPGGRRSNLFSRTDYGLLFPDNASSGHFKADALPLWLSCLFQCLFSDEVLFCQFHRKGKSRFQRADFLVHLVSVQWHRRFHPEGISRSQPAWNEAFFLSSIQKGVPHLRRIFGRQIQFHTCLLYTSRCV